jgi:hypothetical protein
VAERPKVFITAPALPLRYTMDRGLVGTKLIPSPNGEIDERSGEPKSVPILVPIFELDHADQYLFPNPTSQDGFIRGSDGSLIALPPFRRLLSQAYRRREEICRQVEQAMEKAYSTLDTDTKREIALSTLTTNDINVTIFKPGKRPKIRKFSHHPKIFSCKLKANGIFELRAGDDVMKPKPDSHAVTISTPIKTHPTEEHPTPKIPDPIDHVSLPLAYSRTQGLKSTVGILNAGVEKLASILIVSSRAHQSTTETKTCAT